MTVKSQTVSNRFLLFLLFSGLPLVSFAQPVVGFTDHGLLSGYPYSEIVERDLQRDINHRIVLGSLERIRGEVIPEDSERLRGDVTRITYEVSQEFSGEDAHRFFQEQLDSRNYELLFECQGRGCGSSNYWANDIFRNRILYGPESNQYYMAFRANPGLENDPYFSVYIITRVNRRIYAYVEIVEPGGTQEAEQVAAVAVPVPVIVTTGTGAGENLLQRLREQGSVIVPALEFQANDRLAVAANIEPIVATLNADQSLMVYLVAHLTEDGQTLEVLMRRSAARATALRQALLAAGIEARRIQAAGVGPLAPNCVAGNCAERIELVLR